MRCQAVLLHSSCTEPIERVFSTSTTCPNLEGTNPRPQLSATPLGAACGTWLASEPKCSAEAFGGPDPLPFAPAVLGWQSYKPPCTLRPKTRPARVGLGGAPPARRPRSSTDPLADGLLTYPFDGGRATRTPSPHTKKEEQKPYSSDPSAGMHRWIGGAVRSNSWCSASCTKFRSVPSTAPVSYTHLRAHET